MQNLLKCLAFTCFTLMLASCRKEDSLKDKDGVVISQPPIWAITTTDDDALARTYIIRTKAYFNGNLIIGAKKASKDLLRSVDLNDGHTIWDWNEYLPNSRVKIRSFDKMDSQLTFFDYHYVYQVDINTGKTIISRDQ